MIPKNFQSWLRTDASGGYRSCAFDLKTGWSPPSEKKKGQGKKIVGITGILFVSGRITSVLRHCFSISVPLVREIFVASPGITYVCVIFRLELRTIYVCIYVYSDYSLLFMFENFN